MSKTSRAGMLIWDTDQINVRVVRALAIILREWDNMPEEVFDDLGANEALDTLTKIAVGEFEGDVPDGYNGQAKVLDALADELEMRRG